MKKIKDFIKKNKLIIIAGITAIVVLAIAFFSGNSSQSENAASTEDSVYVTRLYEESTSCSPSDASETTFVDSSGNDLSVIEKKDSQSNVSTAKSSSSAKKDIETSTEPCESVSSSFSEESASSSKSSSSKASKSAAHSDQQSSNYSADSSVSESASNTQPSCTLSVSCATILNNKDKLSSDKEDIIPADGWILYPETVEFTEGESAFDVLQRICKSSNINLEFSFTPLYNSIYIEGIDNIMEFDCGSLSGWNYSVNGTFPNYSCSEYILKNGDVLKFEYTCNLGKDIGNKW